MAHDDRSPAFSPGYHVRRCRRGDLTSVWTVESSAFAGHALYPEFFFAQSLDIFADGFLVAERAGDVVGYLIAVLGQGPARQGWVVSLAVHPHHQKRGVGNSLTAAAESFMAAEACKESVLTVDPENTPALRLYARRGYARIDRLDDHFGPGDHRLLMALPLTEPSGQPARARG